MRQVGVKNSTRRSNLGLKEICRFANQTQFYQTNRSNPPAHHQQCQYLVGITSLVKEKSTNQKARPRLVHLLWPNKIIIFAWFLRLAYFLDSGNHKKECLATNVNIPTTFNGSGVQQCTRSIFRKEVNIKKDNFMLFLWSDEQHTVYKTIQNTPDQSQHEIYKAGLSPVSCKVKHENDSEMIKICW